MTKKTKNYGRMPYEDSDRIMNSLYDEEITYNVHPDILLKANSFVPGDLVETAEGHVGLVVGEAEYDRQGFLKYEINIAGKNFLYSSIEMKKLENK